MESFETRECVVHTHTHTHTHTTLTEIREGARKCLFIFYSKEREDFYMLKLKNYAGGVLFTNNKKQYPFTFEISKEGDAVE